jgi:hypothetical protein
VQKQEDDTPLVAYAARAVPGAVTGVTVPSALEPGVVRPRHRVAGDGPVVNGGWSGGHTVPSGGNVPSTT